MKQILIISLLLSAVVQSLAFQLSPLLFRHHPRTSVSSSSLLTAKKKKRSVLGEVAASGGVPPTKRTTTSRQQTNRTTTSKKKATAGVAVSPALAEWASSSETSSATTTTEQQQQQDDSSADTFVPFKQDSKKSSRRVKQSARKEQEAERQASVERMIENLNTVLEDQKKSSLDDILHAIRPFLTEESGNLKLLTAGGAKRYNYRLAWVGSDDALCHFGTGLHKVPLARMQEVFLTCQGKGRVEILEVIRILGPFPNVRNTLQGDAKVKRKNDDVTEWEIVMDSMIDGTGKEILAGTDDNIRRVKLDVYFSDANAILAVVPPKDGGVWQDPLQDSGENALLFIREDDLDAKLDMMRVS